MAGSRRTNREGEAPVRDANGRWSGRVTIELPDGTTKRVRRRGRTRADVIKKYREAQEEALRGVVPSPRREAGTFETYANDWLRAKAAPLLQLPKSRAGTRMVPLSPRTVGVFTEAKEEQARRRKAGLTPHPELPDPVIPGPDWVRPASITTDSMTWSAVLRRMGFPAGVNLHSARHTAATRMLTGPAGADVATVGAILGHSTLAPTAAYLHADETRSRTVLDSYLGGLVGEEAAERRQRIAHHEAEIQGLKAALEPERRAEAELSLIGAKRELAELKSG